MAFGFVSEYAEASSDVFLLSGIRIFWVCDDFDGFLCPYLYANITLNILDVVKAIVMCIMEVVFLRFVMAFVQITAFIGYRSKKKDWGRIQRQKINIK